MSKYEFRKAVDTDFNKASEFDVTITLQYKEDSLVLALVDDKETAAKFVKCVNAYDDLIEALQAIANNGESQWCSVTASAALAKAEAE